MHKRRVSPHTLHIAPISRPLQPMAVAVEVEEAHVGVQQPPEADAVHSTSTARPARRKSPSHHLSLSLIRPSISDSDKKIHQSWGGDDGNTELKAEQAATVDAAAEGWGVESAPIDEWAIPEGTGDAAAAPDGDKPEREGRPRRDREVEEDDNTLTLEQYHAQQKDKESAIPKLENTRQANEGADANIWKDVVPLSKNEEEDAYFVGKVYIFF